jgi:hypothetical protein
MRNVFLCSLFLGLAGLLLGADDPFAGTRKFNIAKSKPAPSPAGMAIKEQTSTIEETNGQANVTIKGTRENGSAISTKYSTPRNGGPVTYSEGGPPAGVSVASKRINDRTVELVTSRDGKEVSTTHVTVSSDGKTMRLATSGVDAQSKPVHSRAVYEKQ